MVRTRRGRTPDIRAARLWRVAVVAVGVGIATAVGHDVAWADPGQSDSLGNPLTHSSSEMSGGPGRPGADRGDIRRGPSAPKKAPNTGTTGLTTAGATSAVADSTTAPSPAAGLNSQAPQHDSAVGLLGGKPYASGLARAVYAVNAGTTQFPSQPQAPAKSPPASIVLSAERSLSTAPAAAVTTSTPTTPSAPGPLSPIAEIFAAPGRIINTVLQALDFTASSNGPTSPLDFAPIDEALFAAFRSFEKGLGLDKSPPMQQVPPTEIYTGPADALTPTVAQFLNAAAAEYVLGGTPGGLQPFTVNGVQLKSLNVLSGESAQVWVTPQSQIIIAYQGTTGGTNLLFHPVIAVFQFLADVQVIFTDTTPQAFTDALAFARRVQAAAAEQGYGASDIFVTGHSLGGWEAQYVAQQVGFGGIGFEGPGLNTTVPGNGVDSEFVNVETYGDSAAYLSTDLPGLQPFMPAYVPGGGSKPHYGSIVMIGDPNAITPLINASSLWGTGLIGDVIFLVDFFGNFFQYHLPGIQAYHLGVSPDPGVVPWLGSAMGPVDAGWGNLTIQQLKQAASLAGRLITP